MSAEGDFGQVDRLSRAAVRGYALADAAPEASNVRFAMGLTHVDGLGLAGELDRAATVADELSRQAGDIDASHSVSALLKARAAMMRGQCAVAQQLLREALAVATARDGQSNSVRVFAGVWLATVLAMTGDHTAAHTELEAAARGDAAELPLCDVEIALARAWVHACGGLPSRGASVAVDAATRARAAGRPAREVVCLQTAVQFGDTTAVTRLAALRAVVTGPRVGAAHAHALALRDGDAAGLLAASDAYAAFGDRIAAADASAQAAAVYRQGGFKGSSLTAAALSERLAAECGATTAALRALATPVQLTARQREVIAMAATGLSNKQIAAQLHTSVRTVEGHLFRACQKAGVTTRDQLVALFVGPSMRGT
jgi:DNA-binding CsgD family transcriptional regulator